MARLTFTDQDLLTYRAAQAIGQLVHSQGRPKGFWVHDQRSYGVRYSDAQTTRGLYVTMSGSGMPLGAITPWGRYSIAGSFEGTGRQIETAIANIMAGMDLKKDEAAREAAGITGYWLFAVRRVGKISLPEPQLRPQSQHIPKEEAMRRWAALGCAGLRWAKRQTYG